LGLSPLSKAGLGISSGMNWAEAISRGLLNVCKYITVAQLERAQYPQVDLAAISLSPEGTRQRHLLEQIGDITTVYDITGPLQIPTFAICIRDKTVAYSTHVDVAQALRDGLEQATLSNQLSGEKILVDNLPFVPNLPRALRGGVRTGASPVPTIPSQE